MNRITFLFLALLIASCILTVNSRHETRTVITEKSVLTERVNSLQETIRRLELDKARLAAKGGADEETCEAAPEVTSIAATPAADSDAAPVPAAAPISVPSAPAVKTPVAAVVPAHVKAVAPTAVPVVPLKPKAPAKASDVEDDPLAAALAKMEAKAESKKKN